MDDKELREFLSRIWLGRSDRYSELRDPDKTGTRVLKKVEMYRVGG